jgi:outer membrane lipoprotein-sorting protein
LKSYGKLMAPLFFSFFLVAGYMQSNPIQLALEKYEEVKSYSVTLRSSSEGEQEEIKYYFKRPGFVRMDFIKPYNGTVLVYNPLTKKVTVRPVSFIKSLVLTLKPDNPILKSSKKHTVDQSDIGVLLTDVNDLASEGTTSFMREEKVGNRDCVVIDVTGKQRSAEEGVVRYLLWLDKDIFLPVKVEAYDQSGELVEKVLMDDLQINIDLLDHFFKL